MIYNIYMFSSTLGSYSYLINKFYICCMWNNILRTTCALMLCTKLIIIRRICTIWMPSIIETCVIRICWHNPIVIRRGFIIIRLPYIFHVYGTGYLILRSTSFLPLCTELIYQRRICSIWVPSIIKRLVI